MSRTAGIIAFVLALLLAAAGRGEIVRVRAEHTRLYDGETKETKSVSVQGKRFMVYGAAKGWYLIEATIKGEKKLVWIPMADVEVDWGQVKQARVVGVPNTSTLELEGDQWVRFAGIEVTHADSPLTRQTLAWLKGQLEGKEVTLEFDPEFTKDSHGYTLAYVYVGGLFVNRTLVEYGLAAPLTSYKTGEGRYASVFIHFEKSAKGKGLGVWAGEKPAETPVMPTEQEQPSQDTGSGPGQVQVLSSAERMQWARNLVTEIKVFGTRDKTSRIERDADNPAMTIYVDELVWTKTLTITVKNGWGHDLGGLSITYEFFGKSGATSDTVTLVKTGAVEAFDLKPSETRVLTSEPVEFKGTDSSDKGWVGLKFYGYRVTYSYKGATVKVDALPTSLVTFRTGQGAQ